MRRKEFISKKLAILLMAVALVVGPVGAGLAVQDDVYAAEEVQLPEGYTQINDNPTNITVDVISEDEYMKSNDGTVNTNNGALEINTGDVWVNNGELYDNKHVDVADYGWVEDNNGGIYYNHAQVFNNNESGQIGKNDGDIYTNKGIVVINDYNRSIGENEGTVLKNYGWVYNSAGTIDANAGVVLGSSLFGSSQPSIGTVNDFYGGYLVNGSGENDVLTVNNFYGGTIDTVNEGIVEDVVGAQYRLAYPRLGTIVIEKSYADDEFEDVDHVVIKDQYHSVDVYDANNIEVNYNNFDDKKYTQTKEDGQSIPVEGTLTLKGTNGYALVDDGCLSDTLDKVSFSLNKNDDGSYTVSLSSLTGNVQLTPEQLHLLLTAISGDDGANINVDSVKVKIDETIAVGGGSDNGSDNKAVAEPEAATPAGTVITQNTINDISDQVQKQMSAQGNDQAAPEVIDIYFGDKIDCNPDIIKYLCEKIPVAKRCHYDYKDQEYVMYIPAFDLVAPAYTEGLETLSKEPGKTAGFLRITQIFEKVGFATKVVEEQPAE